MLTVLGAIVPVFLLIVLGQQMRARSFLDDGFWAPAEKLTYYVTFPALLVGSIAQADLAGLPVLELAGAAALATMGAAALSVALKPLLGIGGPAFTSVLQGAMRPNTYVGLAVAASLWQGPGVTMTAICVAVVVPLVNLISVLGMVRWAAGEAPGWRGLVWPVIKNPLINACLLGIALNLSGLGLPSAVAALLKILGAAALPIGLLAVGAGLDLGALRRTGAPVLVASGVKLVALPLLAFGLAIPLGLNGMAVGVAVLYCALPCSASAYVLARQMGGDAPLMANIITAQTLLAAGSLPLFLVLFG
ncbi:MAG: AEC family transporter [Alphaproteobacteria bacterium]|nr:AEC family transporter [Alphaproteobacteria bacterium]